MKKLSALLVVLALVFAVSSSYAQPQLKINLYGAYNLPMPDLKGDILDSIETSKGENYGMKMGYGFGAEGKYYLGKKRNVGITLNLGYQMFSTSEDTITYLPGGSNVKMKLNAFNFGLGIEYAFMPKGKVNPFIGAEFTGHMFSGNTEGSFGGVTSTADLESASRFGTALGFGVDFKIAKTIAIVVGGKYHLANLIGKDFDTTFTTGKYNLNDKEYTFTSTAGSTTIAAKNISYIQAYLGVSFYLNMPKTTKK